MLSVHLGSSFRSVLRASMHTQVGSSDAQNHRRKIIFYKRGTNFDLASLEGGKQWCPKPQQEERKKMIFDGKFSLTQGGKIFVSLPPWTESLFPTFEMWKLWCPIHTPTGRWKKINNTRVTFHELNFRGPTPHNRILDPAPLEDGRLWCPIHTPTRRWKKINNTRVIFHELKFGGLPVPSQQNLGSPPLEDRSLWCPIPQHHSDGWGATNKAKP